MPRYTYECEKCAHSFETLEGWEASTRKRCPECKSMAKRMLRPPALVFKGSGFYATDHRSSRFPDSSEDSEGSSGNDGAESGSSSSDGDTGKGSNGNGASSDAKPKAKKTRTESKAAE